MTIKYGPIMVTKDHFCHCRDMAQHLRLTGIDKKVYDSEVGLNFHYGEMNHENYKIIINHKCTDFARISKDTLNLIEVSPELLKHSENFIIFILLSLIIIQYNKPDWNSGNFVVCDDVALQIMKDNGINIQDSLFAKEIVKLFCTHTTQLNIIRLDTISEKYFEPSI